MKRVDKMDYKYENIKINYTDNLNNGEAIVLLHGWGQNIAMMEPIGNAINNNYRIITVDFPGFGESEEPTTAWDVDQYVEMLKSLLDNLDVDNPILIGHSFGCRVAIKYCSKYKVKKMIFTGAAGIRPKRGISYYAKVYSYKFIKMILKLPILNKIGVGNNYGSEDYRNASSSMKGTFIKVVNEDLTPYLSKINCPVLLIWGKNDEAKLVFIPSGDGCKGIESWGYI